MGRSYPKFQKSINLYKRGQHRPDRGVSKLRAVLLPGAPLHQWKHPVFCKRGCAAPGLTTEHEHTKNPSINLFSLCLYLFPEVGLILSRPLWSLWAIPKEPPHVLLLVLTSGTNFLLENNKTNTIKKNVWDISHWISMLHNRGNISKDIYLRWGWNLPPIRWNHEWKKQNAYLCSTLIRINISDWM